MADFTTRVELLNADWSDYEALHKAMERQGFSRTITGSSGSTYNLPPAEYNLTAAIKRSDVLDRAKAAAKTTGKKHRILITESVGRTMYNLEEA